MAAALITTADLGVAGAATGNFTVTGSLGTARASAISARLANGQVLIAGGEAADGTPLASAELYSPATASWSPTGALPLPVTQAAMSLLANGDVLLAGGLTLSGGSVVPTAATEIYHVATGTWTTSGSLSAASYGAGAALLSGGDVLYAGGFTSTGTLAPASAAAQRFNPSSQTWSATGSLPLGVARAQMRALSDGSVLLAGGQTSVQGALSALAEVYHQATGSWTSVAQLPTAVAGAATVLLTSGQVLVIGGTTAPGVVPSALTQRYEPTTGSWTITGSLPSASVGGIGVLLGSGQVLYSGGLTAVASPTSAAALFDPGTGQWVSAGNLTVARSDAAAVRLSDGNVLIAGGRTASGVTAVSELYGGVAPIITSAASFAMAVGIPSRFTVTATGTPTPTLSLSGALPAGVSFSAATNGTAVIWGTPASWSVGRYDLLITASNGIATPATQHFVLSVAYPSAPTITSPESFLAHAGTFNSFSVATSGWPTPTISASGLLPPGLAFHDNANGTATIAGVVASYVSGDWALTIVASNGVYASASQHLVISFPRAPQITSGASFAVHDGVAASFTVTTSGVPAPRLSLAGALPEGLSFSDHGDGTATIAGTPSVAADRDFTVSLTAENEAGRAVADLHISAFAAPGRVASGTGYWYVSARGRVVAKGAARILAPITPQHPRQIVGMASSLQGAGYYLVSSSGGVFNYGDAIWYGSIASKHLATPTVAIAVTPSGRGYYLITRAGNVFCFGDAHFFGSTARRGLPPLSGMALMPNGTGYWLATTKGNVYAFGAARFVGSPARLGLTAVRAIAAAPDGLGYWVVAANGQIFNYGSARHFGSMAGRPIPPVTAFAPTADGGGYWLLTRAGNVFNLGGARFYGSSIHQPLVAPYTGFAARF
ncbi:MAG: putative Ig domain-containing protein [Actinomycetota bacterium]|nr:putative Ig domain-containing protein [Actinomycetota bacterium]